MYKGLPLVQWLYFGTLPICAIKTSSTHAPVSRAYVTQFIHCLRESPCLVQQMPKNTAFHFISMYHMYILHICYLMDDMCLQGADAECDLLTVGWQHPSWIQTCPRQQVRGGNCSDKCLDKGTWKLRNYPAWEQGSLLFNSSWPDTIWLACH